MNVSYPAMRTLLPTNSYTVRALRGWLVSLVFINVEHDHYNQ